MKRIFVRIEDTEIVCRQCDVLKEITEMSKNNASPSGYARICKVCRALNERRSRQENPDISRRRNLKSNYDLTLEEWKELFFLQKQQCAICKTTDFRSKGPQTDHDHLTGNVRGILCHWCNITVGHVENGWPLIIPEIEKYLEVHRALVDKKD